MINIRIRKVALATIALCSCYSIIASSRALAVQAANGDLSPVCFRFFPGTPKRAAWNFTVNSGLTLFGYSFVVRAFPSRAVVSTTGLVPIVGGTTGTINSELSTVPDDTTFVTVTGYTLTTLGYKVTENIPVGFCPP